MATNIVEVAKKLALIRYVINWHLQSPTTQTNEAFGSALSEALAEGVNPLLHSLQPPSQGVNSLQRLWANLQAVRVTIDVLSDLAKITCDEEKLGLKILDLIPKGEILVKTVRPLQRLLHSWLSNGSLVEDIRREFFVVRDQSTITNEASSQLQQWLYWDDEYRLVESLIPQFLKKEANVIFEIGKLARCLPRSATAKIEDLFAANLSSLLSGWHQQRLLEFRNLIQTKLIDDLICRQTIFLHQRSDVTSDYLDLVHKDMQSTAPKLDVLRAKWTEIAGSFADVVVPAITDVSLGALCRWMSEPFWNTDNCAAKSRCFSLESFLKASVILHSKDELNLARKLDQREAILSPSQNLLEIKRLFVEHSQNLNTKGFQLLTFVPVNLKWPIHIVSGVSWNPF